MTDSEQTITVLHSTPRFFAKTQKLFSEGWEIKRTFNGGIELYK